MKNLTFRYWDKSLKQWDYFTPSNVSAYLRILSTHILNGDEPYLFTGLKDRNGKDIYEGDIVKYILAEYYPPEISSVPDITDEGQGEVYYNKLGFEIKDAEYPMDCYELEIIGNIHENPELLEE